MASEVTESRRAKAFYRAEERALRGSEIDQGATPAAIRAMAVEAGQLDVKVVVHYGIGRAVAAARPAKAALHFTPSALTIPKAIHEIAHLVAGSTAEHGEEFVTAFVRLVANVGGVDLAARFEEVLEDEGAGLWELPTLRHSVA